MPVKVQVPQLGTLTIENAAEESTMRAILAAINKQGGVLPKGGESSNKAGATQSDEDKTAEINNKRMKDGADAEKRFHKVIQGTSDVFQNSARDFSKTFSNETPSIRNFAGILANYSPEPFATAMTELGGTMNDQVEIFRQLSQSGIDLGDSLLEAQLNAGKARLPLEIFGKTVKENSQMLSMAFGTASQGAQKFAEIQGKFMATSGQKFAALGFSMDELASYNASYMDQMQRSGRLSKMSTDEIVAGQEKYNQELDKMAKATGISRQQLDEANQATQRDARMRLATQKLSKDQQVALEATTQQLNKLDPSGEFSAGLKDLIASGGVATTKAARDAVLAASKAGVDLQGISKNIYNGVEGSVQDLNNGLRKVGQAGANLSEGDRKLGSTLATMGQKTPGLLQASIAGFQDLTDAQQKAAKEQEEKLKSADPTRKAAGLDQTLTEIQNSFKKSIIDTKVFDVTSTGLLNATAQAEKFADGFAKLNTTEKMAVVVGVEAAKVIGSTLLEAAVGGAGGAYGARKAGMAWDEYQARKDGKIKATEPIGTKVPGAAAEATEKTLGARATEAVVKTVKKALFYAATIGGTLYIIDKIDLAGLSIDGMLGDSAKKPERLSLEEERRRDRVPGAELPKSAENNMSRTSAPVESPADNEGRVAKLNQEVNALKTALKDVDYSKLMFPEAVGSSIDSGVIKLKNLREEITTTTSAFKDLNNTNLDQLNTSITKLSDTIKSSMKPEQKEGATGNVKVSDASSKEMVDLLNQLNMTMTQLVSHQSDAVDYLSKTAKYTRQTSNNSA